MDDRTPSRGYIERESLRRIARELRREAAALAEISSDIAQVYERKADRLTAIAAGYGRPPEPPQPLQR